VLTSSFHCTLSQVFESLKPEDRTDRYKEFLDRYKDSAANEKMKSAMTDIAFAIAQKVWTDLPPESGGRGNCFFCIGGVNAVNPFSATAVKNEIIVYVDKIPPNAKHIPTKEGTFLDNEGQTLQNFDLLQYDEIYMDFNGSMAFFGEDWRRKLGDAVVQRKVCLI
jgi:hypothetical protein